jgi:pimeloyl-ACP methyl ester carboxylesterase
VSGRRGGRLPAALAAVVLLGAGQLTAAVPAKAAVVDGSNCGLVTAPDSGGAAPNAGARDGDGSSASPGADGTPATVPVLFVHGMASSAETWWAEGEDSLADEVAAIPGVSVFAFDYSMAALDWVTDPRIGPALGQAISCLAQDFDEPVIVVAHSMGGLATQFAVAQTDPNTGGTVAQDVDEVITLGTPYRGSALLSGLQGGVSGLEAAVDAIPIEPPFTTAKAFAQAATSALEATLSACAGAAAANNAAGPCNVLVSVARSPVGTALEYDSNRIKALPPWPATLPVFPMAGNMLDTFGAGSLTTTFDLGDGPVSQDSALAHNSSGASPVQVYCQDVGILQALSSACAHTNLMANPDIKQAVVEDITAAIKANASEAASDTGVLGLWKGTYTCSQGLTGLTLDIEPADDGKLSAVWQFYADPANPGVPSGSYTMTGAYTQGVLNLAPDTWVSEPANYSMVGLSAKLLGGGEVLSGPVTNGCGTATLTRVGPHSAAADPLTGTWSDSSGDLYAFTENSPGHFTANPVGPNASCQVDDDITVSGYLGHYDGSMDIYSGCKSVSGTGQITMDVAASGKTAAVTTVGACSDCGTGTWTKVSGPGSGATATASP